MKKEVILVTGGTGFVGRYLVWELSKEYPNRIIRVLCLNPNKIKKNKKKPNIEYVEADISKSSSLRHCFDSVDIVYHLASLKLKKGVYYNEKEFYKVNVESTKRLIDYSVANNVSVFVYMSSTGVYGRNGIKHCDEDSTCVPHNLYEETKLEAEKILGKYERSSNIRIIILRPSNIFGENHPQNHLLTLINSIRHSKFALIKGKEGWINYIYAKDVAYIAVKLTQNSEASGFFILNNSLPVKKFALIISQYVDGPKRFHSYPYFLIFVIALMFDTISRITGKKLPLTISKVKEIANKQVFVSKRLHQFYSKNFPYGIEKGIKNTIDYYRVQQLV